MNEHGVACSIVAEYLQLGQMKVEGWRSFRMAEGEGVVDGEEMTLVENPEKFGVRKPHLRGHRLPTENEKHYRVDRCPIHSSLQQNCGQLNPFETGLDFGRHLRQQRPEGHPGQLEQQLRQSRGQRERFHEFCHGLIQNSTLLTTEIDSVEANWTH